MDVGGLLREARERVLVSQGELARAAGTSKALVSRYERGVCSPTVRQLDRLLAAVGLQVRATLEPLLADVDARVDGLLSGAAQVPVDELQWFASAARPTYRWPVEDERTGEVTWHESLVRWAVDGGTALNVHGLAAEAEALGVVLQWDMAARAFLAKGLTRGTAGGAVGWWSAPLEAAQHILRDLVSGHFGFVQMRLVEELPPVLRVRMEGVDDEVPVVPVDEVETAWPQHAEVLARLRARREATRRGA